MGAALAPGTHACCQFRGRDEKQRVIAEFVESGLGRGHRVAYYSRHGDADVLASALGGVTVNELRAEGRLIVGSAQTEYFSGGAFDGSAKVAGFAEFATQTIADGYTGLSVYADNGWMPAALPDPAVWIDYELRVSRMIPGYQLIGLCGFDGSDRTLSAGVIDALHSINVGREMNRPCGFRLMPMGDGFALAGELDRFTLDDLGAVLSGAAPLLHEATLSLDGVTFADAASADVLFGYVQDIRPVLTGVSPVLTKVWRMLGFDPRIA